MSPKEAEIMNEQEPESNVLRDPPPEDAETVIQNPVKAKCLNLKDVHFVVPGSSWGTLTMDLQK